MASEAAGDRDGTAGGPPLVLAALRGIALAVLVYGLAVLAARGHVWVIEHPRELLALALLGWLASLLPELPAVVRGHARLRWLGINTMALVVAAASSLPALAILEKAVRSS